MKIKTTSWHYRFLRKMGHEPKNLCSYVWTLFANIILYFTALLIVALMGYGVVKLTVDTNGIFLLVVGVVISIMFSTAFGTAFVYTKVKNSDNLILSWLCAKKAKMCPLIEYVDNE